MGVNVTVIVQLAPGARGEDETQLSVSAKGAGIATDVTISPAPPVFVKVANSGEEVVLSGTVPKLVTFGAIVATGRSPAPVREIVTGVFCTPRLLSTNVSCPVLVPDWVGVNVTMNEQLVLAARLAGQVFVWAKSPLIATLLIVSGACPVLVRTTVFGAVITPITKVPPMGEKLSEVVDRVAFGNPPVPDRPNDDGVPGVPPVLLVKLSWPGSLLETDGVNFTVTTQLILGARVVRQVLELIA